MTNFILLLGRLTADPKQKDTKGGAKVTTFSLAINGVPNKDGEIQATYFDCVAWEKLGENCAKYLKKGDLVQVTGQMEHRAYMDNTNAKRDYYGVRVNGIEFLTPKPKEEKKETKPVEPVDDNLPF